MNTFKKGQSLTSRSICDHNCIFTAEVLSVSAKQVQIKFMGVIKRVKIHLDNDGSQFIFPSGQYSMAPVFKA